MWMFAWRISHCFLQKDVKDWFDKSKVSAELSNQGMQGIILVLFLQSTLMFILEKS